MKKILLILAVFLVAGCSSTVVEETKDEQYTRLLKEAERADEEKKEQERLEAEKLAGGKTNEIAEVQVSGEKQKYVDPHVGKTRGEIMQYEMAKVKEEMEALKAETDNYVEREKMLKSYKEKLENLEKINKVSM